MGQSDLVLLADEAPMACGDAPGPTEASVTPSTGADCDHSKGSEQEDGNGKGKGSGKGSGKGKGGPPPMPVLAAKRASGPPKSSPPLGIKVKCVEKRQPAGAGQGRLHLSAALQLVAAQELDGHFEARALASKLDRVWSKLMPTQLPGDPAGDLSKNPADATVFMVRLFELFVDSSGCPDERQRHQMAAWFGSSGLLRDRWLLEAESWLAARLPDWREARAEAVNAAVGQWFTADGTCKQAGRFIDNERLQAKQSELSAKFASSHMESLRREELWTHDAAACIDTISWDAVSATRWIMGGGGGAFLVREGRGKFVVKPCLELGDVLAYELARIVGVRVAPMRFVPASSAEFDVACRFLKAALPDEPEHGRRLTNTLAKLQRVGYPLVVIEFVHGDALQGRLGAEALKEGREASMRTLGRLAALDCFINNWDRFPVLQTWPSAGNLGNVMVTAEQEMVGIDQTLHALCDPQLRADYLNALRGFAGEVSQGGSLEGEGMRRVRQAVHSQVMPWTGEVAEDTELFQRVMIKPDQARGVELQDAACCFFVAGVGDVFARTAALRGELNARRTELLERTLGYCAQADAERLAQYSSCIEACLDFVDECMGVVLESSVLDRAPDELGMVPSA